MGLFGEFNWKSWKTIGFSPALAGKAGILFLGLIITALLDAKRSYRETGLGKNRSFNITWDRPFSPSQPRTSFPNVLSG